MKDEFYRGLCDSSYNYDKVVDWIAANNRACKDKTPEQALEFATDAVHSCIRAVMFGEKTTWCATGMCLAVQCGKKVRLAIDLC